MKHSCGGSGLTAPAERSRQWPLPGSAVSDLHEAAIRVVDDKVGTDLTCWATIDPETLVISTITGARIAQEYELWLAEAEYSADEPHGFATLAVRK